MHDLSFFMLEDGSCLSTPESILFPWDLEPRNILVKRKPSLMNEDSAVDQVQLWEVDKGIDWDRVLAVPKILARKPPAWLWDTNSDNLDNLSGLSAYDGDIDILPSSLPV